MADTQPPPRGASVVLSPVVTPIEAPETLSLSHLLQLSVGEMIWQRTVVNLGISEGSGRLLS